MKRDRHRDRHLDFGVLFEDDRLQGLEDAGFVDCLDRHRGEPANDAEIEMIVAVAAGLTSQSAVDRVPAVR